VRSLPTIVHIVDDEVSVRKAVSRLLRASGYDVAVYESGEELLQRLAEEKASGCVLLDMVMPGISGLTVKERLKQVGSVLPKNQWMVPTVPARKLVIVVDDDPAFSSVRDFHSPGWTGRALGVTACFISY
jgi:PleD family two-component response regulator